jgi:hypothetical protein
MSFTVEDFHDLIELLAQRPEWRAELRRHVLSDELLELPALVRQLAEAQARTEATVSQLVEAQVRTEARLSELAEAQGRMETRLGRVEDRLGELDGDVLELRYARLAPAYFGPVARRLRVVETGPLADLLDEAVDEGRLTEEERAAILLANLVLTGRRRLDGQEVYVLAESSGSIGPYDVERAVERATLLEKLGRPVLPVVAGRRINEETAKLAHELGVWYAEGGRVVPPRSA